MYNKIVFTVFANQLFQEIEPVRNLQEVYLV